MLLEGTTASCFKALDSFLSFFLLAEFLSLMNVNILRRLDIVIKKSHIFHPNADFKYVPFAGISRVATTYLDLHR